MSYISQWIDGTMEGARHIIARIRKAGHEAYLVGGCVRDLLLGMDSKDFDVATSAAPEEVAALFKRTIPTGLEHGTVTVLHHKRPYEVTTYRKDLECDGRHARTEWTEDLLKDLSRRDFTLNAMAMDPDTKRVVDPFGGQADLDRRLIRCVGDPALRFNEDYLRMLRAVRFACQLGFEIEGGTWRSLCALASGVSRVSAERIGDEFLGILDSPHPVRGVRLLDASSLLSAVLPEVASLKGVDQPPSHHHLDVYEHTLLALEEASRLGADLPVRLAVLLHDVGKPLTRTLLEGSIHFHGHEGRGAALALTILDRLKLPASRRMPLSGKLLRDKIGTLIRMHLQPFQLGHATGGALRRFVRRAGDHLQDLLLLARADRLAHRDPDTSPLDALEERLRDLGPASAVRALDCPLTGDEIMDISGLPPGPGIGRFKRRLTDALIDGELPNDRAAAEEQLRAWLREEQGEDGT